MDPVDQVRLELILKQVEDPAARARAVASVRGCLTSLRPGVLSSGDLGLLGRLDSLDRDLEAAAAAPEGPGRDGALALLSRFGAVWDAVTLQ